MTSMKRRLEEALNGTMSKDGAEEFIQIVIHNLQYAKSGSGLNCCIQIDHEGWKKCAETENFLPEQVFNAFCTICKAEMRSTLKSRNLM